MRAYRNQPCKQFGMKKNKIVKFRFQKIDPTKKGSTAKKKKKATKYHTEFFIPYFFKFAFVLLYL